MSQQTTVHVKNISQQTAEKDVRDFFSFCGKINSLSLTPTGDGTSSAAVTFEKSTAAKTALLLDNTQLGPNLVQVTPAATFEEMTSNKAGDESTGENHDLEQEDKPRSRILAEYIAHGYTISDKAIEKALDVDKQHGISNRFTNALQQFDAKYKASEKAQQLDAKYGASEKANSAWAGLSSYFEKAMGTPTGQKVRDFYVAGNKQVMDVHSEARRLADLKSGKSATTMEQVPGTNKTTCNCGAELGKCPCEPGKCACSSCPKNAASSEYVKTAADVDPRTGEPALQQ